MIRGRSQPSSDGSSRRAARLLQDGAARVGRMFRRRVATCSHGCSRRSRRLSISSLLAAHSAEVSPAVAMTTAQDESPSGADGDGTLSTLSTASGSVSLSDMHVAPARPEQQRLREDQQQQLLLRNQNSHHQPRVIVPQSCFVSRSSSASCISVDSWHGKAYLPLGALNNVVNLRRSQTALPQQQQLSCNHQQPRTAMAPPQLGSSSEVIHVAVCATATSGNIASNSAGAAEIQPDATGPRDRERRPVANSSSSGGGCGGGCGGCGCKARLRPLINPVDNAVDMMTMSVSPEPAEEWSDCAAEYDSDAATVLPPPPPLDWQSDSESKAAEEAAWWLSKSAESRQSPTPTQLSQTTTTTTTLKEEEEEPDEAAPPASVDRVAGGGIATIPKPQRPSLQVISPLNAVRIYESRMPLAKPPLVLSSSTPLAAMGTMVEQSAQTHESGDIKLSSLAANSCASSSWHMQELEIVVVENGPQRHESSQTFSSSSSGTRFLATLDNTASTCTGYGVAMEIDTDSWLNVSLFETSDPVTERSRDKVAQSIDTGPTSTDRTAQSSANYRECLVICPPLGCLIDGALTKLRVGQLSSSCRLLGTTHQNVPCEYNPAILFVLARRIDDEADVTEDDDTVDSRWGRRPLLAVAEGHAWQQQFGVIQTPPLVHQALTVWCPGDVARQTCRQQPSRRIHQYLLPIAVPPAVLARCHGSVRWITDSANISDEPGDATASGAAVGVQVVVACDTQPPCGVRRWGLATATMAPLLLRRNDTQTATTVAAFRSQHAPLPVKSQLACQCSTVPLVPALGTKFAGGDSPEVAAGQRRELLDRSASNACGSISRAQSKRLLASMLKQAEGWAAQQPPQPPDVNATDSQLIYSGCCGGGGGGLQLCPAAESPRTTTEQRDLCLAEMVQHEASCSYETAQFSPEEVVRGGTTQPQPVDTNNSNCQATAAADYPVTYPVARPRSSMMHFNRQSVIRLEENAAITVQEPAGGLCAAASTVAIRASHNDRSTFHASPKAPQSPVAVVAYDLAVAQSDTSTTITVGTPAASSDGGRSGARSDRRGQLRLEIAWPNLPVCGPGAMKLLRHLDRTAASFAWWNLVPVGAVSRLIRARRS